jgi:hypothetical protein
MMKAIPLKAGVPQTVRLCADGFVLDLFAPGWWVSSKWSKGKILPRSLRFGRDDPEGESTTECPVLSWFLCRSSSAAPYKALNCTVNHQ